MSTFRFNVFLERKKKKAFLPSAKGKIRVWCHTAENWSSEDRRISFAELEPSNRWRWRNENLQAGIMAREVAEFHYLTKISRKINVFWWEVMFLSRSWPVHLWKGSSVKQYPLTFSTSLPGEGGVSHLIGTSGRNKLGVLNSAPGLIYFAPLGSKPAYSKHNFFSVTHAIKSFPAGKAVLVQYCYDYMSKSNSAWS